MKQLFDVEKFKNDDHFIIACKSQKEWDEAINLLSNKYNMHTPETRQLLWNRGDKYLFYMQNEEMLYDTIKLGKDIIYNWSDFIHEDVVKIKQDDLMAFLND